MGYRSILTAAYLAPDMIVTDITKPWGDPGNPSPKGKKLLFVFLPSRRADLEKCMIQYPGGELQTEHGYFEKLFYVYRVELP
jgi:hypothetical protein